MRTSTIQRAAGSERETALVRVERDDELVTDFKTRGGFEVTERGRSIIYEITAKGQRHADAPQEIDVQFWFHDPLDDNSGTPEMVTMSLPAVAVTPFLEILTKVINAGFTELNRAAVEDVVPASLARDESNSRNTGR